jgi:N-acetylmuramoyl-L-alanine amidase
MKRFLSILMMGIVIFGMSISAFGENQKDNSLEVIDGMTAKKQQVKSVKLCVFGEDIATDVPAMLYKNRTLVPIRFVVEKLGAEIKWDQKTYCATITTKDKTIRLEIDNAVAYVNNKKIVLPDNVPAKLLGYRGNYRTMVPFRFVSEQLGMKVDWIPETMTATVDRPDSFVHYPSVTDLQYDQKSQGSNIFIKTTEKVSVTPLYLEGNQYGEKDRLVLDIPNTKLDIKNKSIIEDNGTFKKNIEDNGIIAIRSSLFSPEPKPVTRIVIDLEKKKRYNIFFDQERKGIKVEFLNNEREEDEQNTVRKRIVLDAGHGGNDPGTVGNELKLKEKELTLDTVNRLNKLLEDAGFTTLKTRKDDTYVGLYDRVNKANAFDATVFVSIHYNWCDDPNVSGVEVLYHGNNLTRDNKTFAAIVQEELVKELNARDRKIKERPNLVVLRDTKMPAILTELAFLSNKKEEDLAATEEYRQKCAEAIFKGILRYFDEVLSK